MNRCFIYCMNLFQESKRARHQLTIGELSVLADRNGAAAKDAEVALKACASRSDRSCTTTIGKSRYSILFCRFRFSLICINMSYNILMIYAH
jgi:hypothetical protein